MTNDLHSINFDAGPCLGCGKRLDGHHQVERESVPNEGDIALCIYCYTVMIYGEKMRLRYPTNEERPIVMEIAAPAIKLLKQAKKESRRER